MKTKLLVLAILLFPLMLSAQDIPSNVKQKVKTIYPDAQDIKWDVEGKGQYEAEFKIDGVQTALLFDSEASLIETETKIAVSELPSKVRDYISSEYAGKSITEAAKIIDSKGNLKYEAEITEGKKSKDILFDQNGNVIKKADTDSDEDSEEEDGD
ncbi:MAG: PepSY-like domain-containing protein [Ignavibacteria bacterium]|nr:PepSY-like domain-containing protein [Ignavibacteriota bacterium]